MKASTITTLLSFTILVAASGKDTTKTKTTAGITPTPKPPASPTLSSSTTHPPVPIEITTVSCWDTTTVSKTTTITWYTSTCQWTSYETVIPTEINYGTCTPTTSTWYSSWDDKNGLKARATATAA
ncbi:hypothetical protein P280DRAFT_511147 [Massarina eburnea CBS 473.64]|uniref:Ig-like domain-containing protein n=1 Tax=Massarina eburnea CBS 473.64 TaxID=1395130 RepID=A0A6A6RJP4_9PLEO|nr:hypothetical protein P280DRAFT_511147 [Massarina eburnea CBS 473.64]